MQNEVMARLKLGDDELAAGFRRPIGDMVADRKVLELGKDAVGAPPVRGNSSRSTHSAVYHAPRCQPICTSQGQIRSGGAPIVMA